MSSTQSSPTRGESSGGFFSHIQRTSSPSATCFERALAKSLSRKRGALKKMKRLLTHHKRSKKRFTRDARRVYISFCISVFLHFKTDAARVSLFLCRAKTFFFKPRVTMSFAKSDMESFVSFAAGAFRSRVARLVSYRFVFFLFLSLPLSAIDSNIFKSPW